MGTERPREIVRQYNAEEEYIRQLKNETEHHFPLKFPEHTVPERWENWFEMIDR